MPPERVPGLLVLFVAVSVALAAASAAMDPNLRPGDDWLHEQWVYLFALPMSLVACIAWLLDLRGSHAV